MSNDNDGDVAVKKVRPSLRIQKSRDGRYVQFVLVTHSRTGEKKQMYFSQTAGLCRDYFNGKSNQLFLVASLMVPKDSLKYKFWQKKVALVKKSGVDPNVLG